MVLQSKYILIAATFATAFGAGYIMQNGNGVQARSVHADNDAVEVMPQSVQLASANMPTLTVAASDPDLLQVPTPPAAALEPAPRLPAINGLTDRVNPTDQPPHITPVPQDRSAFGLACDMTFDGLNNGAAMVLLSMSAPCHLQERVEIAHEGLQFAVLTSNTGQFDLAVPALAEQARFVASFANGDTMATDVAVPEITGFDRVALTFGGNSAMHIHALEFGATYGEGGHVWSDAPRSADIAMLARGGFLTRLGNTDAEQPMLAEIYSFPTGTIARDGAVRLSIEAEITAYTCGHDIDARSAQLRQGEGLQWIDLTLAMPECDAIGDFLVLKNVLQDLKIAQN